MGKASDGSTKKSRTIKKPPSNKGMKKNNIPDLSTKMIIESGVLLQGDGDIWIYEKPKVWVSVDVSLKNSDGTYNRMQMGISTPIKNAETKTISLESRRLAQIIKYRIIKELPELQT